jgi:cyanophycin synthetase
VHLSTGGTATDVTDDVHPDNARLAELAAQILALDVAGVDVICRDIAEPIAAQGGAIVEVNAAPGLCMHLQPMSGRPRQVGFPIVDMLYPLGNTGRIPIVAVTGTNGKTTVTHLIGHLFQTDRKLVGMTTTEGTYIGRERILEGDCSGPQSARAVLLHPRVEVAVLETARGGILREGLAFDRCAVGVVTNVSADHLGVDGISTIEDLVNVKQVVVEAVDETGSAVLNADDPRVAEMAAVCKGSTIYFSAEPANPFVAAHLAAGKQAVLVEDGAIVLATGEIRTQLVELERIGFTGGGRIRFQVGNALAATAAAWATGLNPALIVRGLTTFETTTSTVPGRMNVTEIGGVQVVLDYAHNPAALDALSDAVRAMGPRRTIFALALPGDRRNEDIRYCARGAVSFADELVLYDLTDRRNREAGEVPRLIAAEFPVGFPYTIVHDQHEAIRARIRAR